jgi:hypothetical protein
MSQDDDEEQRQLRLEKRRQSVQIVKNSPDYAHVHRVEADLEAPRTPDPGAGLSKRSWEKQMADWRQALRRMAQPAPESVRGVCERCDGISCTCSCRHAEHKSTRGDERISVREKSPMVDGLNAHNLLRPDACDEPPDEDKQQAH